LTARAVSGGGRAGTSGGDRWQLENRRLYLCVPDRPDLEAFVTACIEGGVDVVQLREKHLGDDELLRRAELVRAVCADGHVPFVLNDRPDLARRAGADGVHVGQQDVDPWTARGEVGPDALVGLSTHSTEDLVRAGDSGSGPAPVDYVSAGPVVPTPTKPGRPGTGVGYIGHAVATAPWPVWVTGGVVPESVGALVEAGARHFVVVRWLTEADDPLAHARRLRQAIDLAVSSAPEHPAATGSA
jgi:thiamine-phosphate pyrophosphorylase